MRTLGQLLGMARSDVIGLLSATGGDTAGALSIGQPGSDRLSSMEADRHARKTLRAVIDELPNKPFLVGEEGVSMSLAGAQTKLAVAVDQDGRICIPMNGSPSTHILKPDSPRLWGRRSECKDVLPDAGETHEYPHTECHHRSSRQTNLSTCAEIRSHECRGPLASLAPGGLLSSAWEAAIRQVRV